MAKSGVLVLLILLTCQTWSSLAYRNQQTQWTKEHLRAKHFDGGPTKSIVGRNRHLSETQSNRNSSTGGWTAKLVHERNLNPTLLKLSSMERIQRGVMRSIARSKHLDSKVQRAIAIGEGRSSSATGRKALQADSIQSDVISTLGEYSMSFSLGTPPQQVVAVADTGSDLVWVQCATCTECFTQPTPLFDPTLSSTYATLNCLDTACTALSSNMLACTPDCEYTYSYGDQSETSGDFVSDVFTLNTTTDTATGISNFFFGCGLANNGTYSNTDGIVGLGRGPISFPSQIAASINESSKFSYCFPDYSSSESTLIIFGDSAVPSNFSAAMSTPIETYFDVSMVPYYYVSLLSIAVDGSDLGIPPSAFAVDSFGNGGTIFDSGTTYTVLAPDAYEAVKSAYSSSLTYPQVDILEQTGLELCYDVTGLSSVQVPSLTFTFQPSGAGIAEFDLPFDNIFVGFASSDNSAQYICLAFLDSTNDMNIFGNTQQQNFQMLYDQTLLQISWLPVADCTAV